jgi:hypothetical protein
VKIIRGFLISAGVLLMLTAVAKSVSAMGTSRALQLPDPVISLSYKHVFWITGILELCTGLTCIIKSRHPILPAGLVALLSTNLLVYRLILVWFGYHKPCSCLGTLAGKLHISPQTADTGMKIILAYLFVGSYATLFSIWRKTPQSLVVVANSPNAVQSAS